MAGELEIDFERPTDPLYRDVHLGQVAELPVVGVPVRFETNSAAVLDVIMEAFGSWAPLAAREDLLAPERVRVRLIVHEGEAGASGHARPLIYRAPDPTRVVISSPGSVGIIDLHLLDGVAYVTPSLVAERAYFRAQIVEGITLMLVEHLDRVPIHAAAVARNGVALLLAGASGTGKSTLAYAAASTGLHVLSDDMVFVQLRPQLRVWGGSSRAYLHEQARAHFAELADVPVSVLANGKRKLPVDMASAAERPMLPVVERAGICLLQRTASPAGLERVAPATLQAELLHSLEGGFALFFREATAPRVAALANGTGWRLNLSGHPADAVPYLYAMLDELEARG